MDKIQFFNEIDEIILGLVRKHPDFYFLMKSKTGIHPIDIKASLFRLYNKKKISASLLKSILNSAKDKGKVVLENNNLLPVPHLLDYDWRFSSEGIEKMFSIINKNCKRNSTVIAFVGTPTLFKMYFLKNETRNQYILIDKNADQHVNSITRYSNNFSYIKYNIVERCPINNIKVDLVIMDPPWYLNYNKLFFQFAESIVTIGGKIICVLPPKYTRCRALEELDELQKFISDCGMVKELYLKNAVSYNTPPFERNVLRANGIYCMPKGWRTGDAIIVKKVQKSKVDRKTIIIPEGGWEEINIGKVRYKLKTNYNLDIKSFDLFIEKVYNNDIYPSVRRSSTKSERKINVWTSGNRVFYCTNVQLLYYLLVIYSMQHEHFDIDICNKIEQDFKVSLKEEQKNNIMKCIEFIVDINKKENREYGKWGTLI